jgi:endonuclease/exonuclease/phosphatase family metal-dependent hydrolase
MKLKILSWNIWGGKYLNEVMTFLKDADADIIALQEVIEDDRAGNTSLTIAKKLGYECVYGLGMLMSSKWAGPPREKEETIKFGNAILSKHAITSSKIHKLSVSERRVAVQADLRIGNTILHCFSVHLKHNHVERSNPKILQLQNEQADNLVKILPSEKTVLMGDLNALPESYAVKKMGEVLKNIEKDPGSLTWSVYPEGCDGCLPKGIQYKLDYIFISEDIKAQSFEVGNSKGSDHLPISAIIEI